MLSNRKTFTSNGVTAIRPESCITRAILLISTTARQRCSSGRSAKHQMLKVYGIIGHPHGGTRARFLAPSRFGDRVVVESSISQWRRSSFDVQHKLFKDDVLAVECSERACG